MTTFVTQHFMVFLQNIHSSNRLRFMEKLLVPGLWFEMECGSSQILIFSFNINSELTLNYRAFTYFDIESKGKLPKNHEFLWNLSRIKKNLVDKSFKLICLAVRFRFIFFSPCESKFIWIFSEFLSTILVIILWLVSRKSSTLSYENAYCAMTFRTLVA